MATYYRKWTKQELENKFEQAQKQAAALKSACLAAVKDIDLSESARKRQIQTSIDRMGATIRNHFQAAAGMLKDMQGRLTSEAELDARKTQDAAHQTRLANAMKTLELRASGMSRDEFTELILPMAFDIGAQQALKAAAGAGGMNSWTAAVWLIDIFAPVEARKTAIEKLQEFAEYAEHCWDNMTALESVTGFEAEHIFANISGILKHWNDDLTRYER